MSDTSAEQQSIG